MISIITDEPAPVSVLAAEMFSVAAEAVLVSRILDLADFCGLQEDGRGGRFELWTLRKPIGKHPKGSTISRQTLVGLIEGYGSTTLPLVAPKDFAAVESPTQGGDLP